MEKSINLLKVDYSELLDEDEDYLEEYDEKLNNIFSQSVFEDDFILLATDVGYFLKKYYIKESEINDKFLYVFKNNETFLFN